MQELDNWHIGRFVGERHYEIDASAVRHYSESVDDFSDSYTGTSDFGYPVAPALVLHSDVYRDLSWYLPRIYGNLHARQEWELYTPIPVGERVTTRSQIVDRYQKRGRDYVVNEVMCFGADGALRSRGRTHQSFLSGDVSGVVVDKDREKRPDRRFEVGEGDILELIEGPAKVVTIEMCQKFSGPVKNYHNDVEEARKLGFPDIVVQGMMPLCFVSEMMTQRFGAGWFSGGRMDVNLVNVLWQGEQVRARGAVKERVVTGHGLERATLQVWVEKSDGTKVVVGSASAIV
jgi:acyl dehydratase